MTTIFFIFSLVVATINSFKLDKVTVYKYVGIMSETGTLKN